MTTATVSVDMKILRLADEASVSRRRHCENGVKAAVGRVLRKYDIPTDGSTYRQVLAELGRRGGKKAAETRGFPRTLWEAARA